MKKMKTLLYGAEYYDEYMPYDRLEQDVKLMQEAGINVVRIGESTWSTYEPEEGKFDFSHIHRVLDAMEKAGISVVIGTPTYAVPAWMVKSYPEVMAETANGRNKYGSRQLMDITHPVFRYFAERLIRNLMKETVDRKCVIGYQLDNETEYYGTSGKNIQAGFVKYLKKKFDNDIEAMNREFGLDYWSNAVHAWEEFPDVRGTINGSLGAEFEKYQRTLVTDYLKWQGDIVREYTREDQFVTHNLNFAWNGATYGLHHNVDDSQIAPLLDIVGTDIYHPSQDDLTGMEIAFGGDVMRSLKKSNYLVLETQAQGYPCWLPYEGQLRQQAYAHIASGANMVEYWPWHSIHNSFETYWKGVLGHDFLENETYRSAKVIGNEFKKIGEHLVNLQKENKVAILVSNEALTALNWFPIDGVSGAGGQLCYNEVLRYVYRQLYEMNVECDFLWPDSDEMADYDLIVIPALYAASEELLNKIDAYVKNGGHIIATFKSGFANENVKVYHDMQPHILCKCLGVHYSDFTFPKDVFLCSDYYICEDRKVENYMELLIPDTAKVLASYDHYNWNRYAAVTENHYGKGSAVYIGCWTGEKYLREILADTLNKIGAATPYSNVEFPIIIRKGKNDFGNNVTCFFNFSKESKTVIYKGKQGRELLNGTVLQEDSSLNLNPWGVSIVEETKQKESCV